ncbi:MULTISPECIES: hypothetical protein [Faecalibacter]|uniref:Uncharacterized protein n=2 Tax=Faecalibacter TaxID=2766734 RepID=A0A8J7FPM6_9FLAO|nr:MULTISPECIES: hypothetical protein [Faecalibacter]MBF0598402.1 hypothetical protein [Faecalibacter rhinopitheci]RLZ06408.1 hypothetical protein EAH69_13580 [Faecalibacter macacae]
MEQKTKQIKQLTEHLLEKYGSENILVTDYWDADNTAIGLSDKTKKYTVYITDNGRTDNVFFVSLENPPTTEDFPYTPAGDFDNLSAEEVEDILIKHLKISE